MYPKDARKGRLRQGERERRERERERKRERVPYKWAAQRGARVDFLALRESLKHISGLRS